MKHRLHPHSFVVGNRTYNILWKLLMHNVEIADSAIEIWDVEIHWFSNWDEVMYSLKRKEKENIAVTDSVLKPGFSLFSCDQYRIFNI